MTLLLCYLWNHLGVESVESVGSVDLMSIPDCRMLSRWQRHGPDQPD